MAQAQVSGKTTSTRTRKRTAAQGKRAATKKAPAKKAASPAGRSRPKKADDVRHTMIAETAFYYAEQRGFQGDMAMDDWLRAESEVDARLAGKRRTKAG